jgi:hypothetical protein
MNKKHYFFFAAVVGMALFAQYDVSRRVDNIRLTKLVKTQGQMLAANSTSGKTEASSVAVTQVPTATQMPVAPQMTTQQFVSRFKEEARQIGKLQTNPDETQLRLKKLADKMNPQNVEGLFDIISNDKSDSDQRALAVELLAIKNDTTSLMALQNFVANSKNVNGTKWDHKKEFEAVLRAQAIEGIATFPEKEIALSTLNHLQQKVDHKFLNDRISRASLGLMYENKPNIQQQDEEALKKLIE